MKNLKSDPLLPPFLYKIIHSLVYIGDVFEIHKAHTPHMNRIDNYKVGFFYIVDYLWHVSDILWMMNIYCYMHHIYNFFPFFFD